MDGRRLTGERGFTLIELLVVVLIIGILAAIALPMLLAQRSKSQDAGAKSNARNAVSQVDACYAATQSYLDCDDPSNLPELGITVGARADYADPDCTAPLGGICVNSESNEYRVIARSSSGNIYVIDHRTLTRTCSVVDADNTGGCDTGGSGTTGVW